MGMFDSLKEKLKTFTKSVAKEAEVKEEAAPKQVPPPAPPPKQAPPPAKAAKPGGATEFEVVRRQAPAAAPPSPPSAQKPAPKQAPRPHVEVVKPTPAEKKREAEHFDREMEKVVTPIPGTPPEHVPQGAEFEERGGDFIPATREDTELIRPADQPGLQGREREGHAPARPPAAKTKTIKVDKIDDLLWDLELSLLESDVALPVVEAIKDNLKVNLREVRVASDDDIPQAVESALREAILKVLSLEPIDFDIWVIDKLSEKKPAVIMFVGVNGTGKTTAIGRIAHRLKENGFTTVLAAGDTFRAGAIEQLSKHGERLGVTVIKHQAGADPAAVAYDAIEHAKSRMKDVVLLDTAGRMQTNTNLMDEMKKIKRIANPDMIVFVGDSLAGNDAVEQAVYFDKAVGINAVILTKVDTDAKGGAALSIAHAVGKPILFLGVGQEYGDIVPYDPEWMVNRIFEQAPPAA